jgi:hypothetical protein
MDKSLDHDDIKYMHTARYTSNLSNISLERVIIKVTFKCIEKCVCDKDTP